MNPENKEIHTDLEAEVVVVGGSAAGLAAAVAAEEEGADVILLEKGSSPGGNAGIYGKEIPMPRKPFLDESVINYFCDETYHCVAEITFFSTEGYGGFALELNHQPFIPPCLAGHCLLVLTISFSRTAPFSCEREQK